MVSVVSEVSVCFCEPCMCIQIGRVIVRGGMKSCRQVRGVCSLVLFDIVPISILSLFVDGFKFYSPTDCFGMSSCSF